MTESYVDLKNLRRPLPSVPQVPQTPREIDVFYLHRYGTQPPFKAPLEYLHTRRLAKYACDGLWLRQVREYYGALADFMNCFAEQLPSVAKPDLVVQAPSNDAASDPYFAALVERTAVRNLRRHLWVKDKNHSAGAQSSADAASEYNAFAFRAGVTPDLASSTSVLLVDDVFAEGKTIAATWARLLEAGLPAEAKVVAGVALLV